jgi:hypothetical protein
MAGKLWAFQGEFGKRSSVVITADGAVIPQYLSLLPEQWFDHEVSELGNR